MGGDKLGATGEFPDGKVDPTDEGELRFMVSATDDGLVRLEFGKPVAWLGLRPQDAAGLASALMHHARLAARVTGEPIVLGPYRG